MVTADHWGEITAVIQPNPSATRVNCPRRRRPLSPHTPNLDIRVRQLVQDACDRLAPLDAHHHLPELRVRAEPYPHPDRRVRHPPMHRPHPAELMREPHHRPRRRIEAGRRQQLEPDTGAEVEGTEVSVEDEHRDQDRDNGGGHPPESAARDQVSQTERLRRSVFQHGLTAMCAGEHVGIRSRGEKASLKCGIWRPVIDCERDADVPADALREKLDHHRGGSPSQDAPATT
jgi:hypothetical protein